MTKKEFTNELLDRLWQINSDVMGKYGQGIGFHWIDGIQKLCKAELPEDFGDEGTLAQNAAFHALLQEFYSTGLYSYAGVKSYPELKKAVKRYLGKGFKSFVWVVEEGGIYKTLELSAKEKALANVVRQNGRPLVQGILWSWSDYTKVERKSLIDRLIIDMDTAGVHTPKYQEILAGMQGNTNWVARDSGREQEESYAEELAEKSLAG